MDTMTITKAAGGLFGAFLIFLLGQWAAEALFHTGGHGEASFVIEIEGDAADAEVPEVSFAELFAAADVSKGEKVFKKCSACHKLEQGENATGPSLYGVVGRAVGSVAGFGYSDAMAGAGGDWTPEHLSEFLTKPGDAVPGTSMGFAGLPKIEDRVNLIAFLNNNSDAPFVMEAAAATEADAAAAEATETASSEAATETAETETAATETETATAETETAATETETAAAGTESAGTETEAASTETATAETETAEAGAALAGADLEAGAKVFKKCAACHKLVEGENVVGPYLYGVVGRPVASAEGFSYSDALTGLGGEWTVERLDEFLTKPKDFAPGTTMSFAGVRKDEDRTNLIAYLDSIDN